MSLTPDTPEYDCWMDALTTLKTHDQTCQTCIPNIISGANKSSARCADGERLYHALFQVWRLWYYARIDRTGAWDAQMP